jgi:hypothetical protein
MAGRSACLSCGLRRLEPSGPCTAGPAKPSNGWARALQMGPGWADGERRTGGLWGDTGTAQAEAEARGARVAPCHPLEHALGG